MANRKFIVNSVMVCSLIFTHNLFAGLLGELTSGYPVLQTGGYISTQGQSQFIRINNLVGDRYSVKDRTDANLILGLGYFIKYPQQQSLAGQSFDISYGLNTFYLFPTKTKGQIKQENLFYNLDYEYKTSHLPLYLATKLSTKSILKQNKTAVILNLGVGPSVINFSRYNEQAISNVTMANNLFTGKTDVIFSFMAGLGIKRDPIECSYNFFIFSGSTLKKNNSQVVDSLKSGTSIANALMCSVQFDNRKLSI